MQHRRHVRRKTRNFFVFQFFFIRYWQTETGGAIISPLANLTPMKPGSAALPFFGIEPVVVDSRGEPVKQKTNQLFFKKKSTSF